MEVKALIKYCQTSGSKVVYFKSSGRIFKMTSKKDISLLRTTSMSLLMASWDLSTIEVVTMDEQINYDGKPLFVSKETIKINKPTQRKLGLIT